jgi:hypothetical protein
MTTLTTEQKQEIVEYIRSREAWGDNLIGDDDPSFTDFAKHFSQQWGIALTGQDIFGVYVESLV